MKKKISMGSKELKDKEKQETLFKIIDGIHDGELKLRYSTELSSNSYLKAIAIGIKYLVKNSK